MNNIKKRLLTLISYASREGALPLRGSNDERKWSEED